MHDLSMYVGIGKILGNGGMILEKWGSERPLDIVQKLLSL